MASFVWQRAGEDLSQRYANVDDNDVDGEAVAAWKRFVGTLERGEPPAWRAALSVFVLAVQPLQRVAAPARVFVSHRQKDGAIAEQIAWQATEAGKDYWLDLHDGNLQLASQTLQSSDPRYALIIAGIIEMALLSCTHVIATHTPNSLGSKWIPYELARAKGRQVISNQAAGWFDQSIQDPATQGEYVVLSEICRSRADVDFWLGAHRPPHVPARPFLGKSNPPPIVFH
jgi:hypothetical protein